MNVTILYSQPMLPANHPDYESEAGVLDSVQAVRSALTAAGHSCREIAATGSAAELLAALSNLRPDAVINLCEGFAGHSRHESYVAGLLELIGLPYSGSPPESLALVRDKPRTKAILLGSGLPTPEFFHVARGDDIPREAIASALAAGPFIVKPAAEDASLGIGPESVVTEIGTAQTQISAMHARYGDALVERYIDGREFNVSIIALPRPQVLPLAEIEFQRDPVNQWALVTYESKWSAGSRADLATLPRCPAEVEPELAEVIRNTALEVFRVTGCRDYARIDLRVTSEGEPFVLDVNANPDIGPSAGFNRALAAGGIGYDQFVLRLLKTTRTRNSEFGSRNSDCLPATHPSPLTSHNSSIHLRPFAADDRAVLLAILDACQMFRPDEIEVANEILTETIRDGESAHYRIVVAEDNARAIGWSCYGQVPLTDASYDLYWIAVHPEVQRGGIGRQLLAECEVRLRAAGGRWVLAETSSTAAYDSTRAFYRRCGFQVVADVPDFYRAGDGLITFGKRLDQSASA